VQYHVRTPDGTPTAAGENTLQQLSDWRRSFDHVIVCLDSPPYARKQILPTYKSSRERDDGYHLVCRWTKDRLVKDGYSIAAHTGSEADDVIATLAKRLWDRNMSAFLIGGDKDMAQCVLDSETQCVRIMAPLGGGKWEERDTEWVKTKYGVTPDQMALLQALTGDSTDDVPGIAGIGPKGAAKLINEYGTIEKMRIAAVAALEESMKEGAKPLASFWKKFLAGSPELPKWLSLTTLRSDVPLDVDALLVKQPIQPLMATPENIEHGDAWEPSAEELQEEREMLAPEDVISGPKVTTPDQRVTTGTSADATVMPAPSDAMSGSNPRSNSDTGKGWASSDPKPAAGPAESTQPAPAPSSLPSNGTAQRAKQQPVSEEPVSIVVDRPAPPSWALALQPASVKEADILSAKLFNSRHYNQFSHAPGVLSVILKGRELGLGAMAALEMFFVVKDRPYPSAKGLMALAERDPNCEWIMVTSADDTHATVKTKHRKAGLLEYTYTAERARKAGYFTGGNKHNWNTITQEMLESRASSKAVNRWYRSATFGMHSYEEAIDTEGVEVDNE
jgi:DNA polymerase-1